MADNTGLEKIQAIIFWITGIILASILIATLVFAIDMACIKMPPLPNLDVSSNESAQQVKAKEIENYEKLCKALQTQKQNIYTLVITDTLLAIFKIFINTVLLFVFGKLGFKIYKQFRLSKISASKNI